jgi:hypothetical protein
VTPPVWNRPQPLGAAAGGTTFGLVAAPLLAGFSLSAVLDLVKADDGGLRGDVGIAAFATAAALLVFTVQASISASRFQVSPADRIAWIPEAGNDPVWREWLHAVQWRDEELARRLRARAKHSYNLGIVAFLAGLVSVLVPDPGDWQPGRIVAVAAAGLALLIELVLIAGRPRRVRAALMPTIDDYEAERTRSARTQVPPAPEGLQQAVSGVTDDIAPILVAVDGKLNDFSERLAALEATVAGLTSRRPWWRR